ncbi:hypothetical protein HYW75_00005 [Candidatus Pacearchaeota archaeon]|nr:hypothetical protein [Candidatus Pacearchaeota archaeon]
MALEKLLTSLISVLGIVSFNHVNAENKIDNIKVGFSSEIANEYVAKPGFIFGSGPVNQTTLSLSINNVIKKEDTLSVFAWSNYDITDREIHEVDTGLNYSRGFNIKNGKLMVEISPQYWFYPSGLILNYDYAFDARVRYQNNIANTDLLFRNIFAHENTPNRQIYCLTESKSFKAKSFGVVPGITLSFINGFPGTKDGLAHITPKANFEYKKGNSSVFFNAGYQFGFNTDKVKNTPVISIGFGLNF